MARPDYQKIAIQTYRRVYGEQSKHEIRVRPLSGQNFPKTMNVECSVAMRVNHPVGTCFIVRATVKRREGGPPFLYTSWQWPHKRVSLSMARKFVRAKSLLSK